MSDRRKAELEQKKARLAAMREERRKKEEEKKSSKVGVKEADGSNAAADVTQIFDELGIPSPSQSSSQHSNISTSSSRTESISSLAEATPQPVAEVKTPIKRKVQLTTSKVTQTNIPPKENVSYSKETQTQQEQFERDALTYVDDDADSMEVGVDTPPPGGVFPPHSHAHHQHHIHHRMPQVEMARPAGEAGDGDAGQKKEEDKPVPARELTEEEKDLIVSEDDFIRFIEKSARIIERAVNEDTDIFVDYCGEDDSDKEGGLSEGEKVKLGRQFFDERWSKHRIISSLDWSTQHPELLLASYNTNEESPHEPDGVALIWNLKFKKTTPEHIFHCQSAVTSACFAKFHPNLIVGGTYSGQIVLWDNRSHKRTPVQRTPLSASAHTHPIYCMQVVGTPNAHNLVSISTDGRLCAWSLDMLAQPAEAIELQHKQSSRAVAATCLAFLPGDVNNFVVGSEEGAVYSACRHGSKAGIGDIFEGHQGTVTGIHTHSAHGPIDFSPYFLTSSFDWTIKLWNAKESRPLYSFEDNSDYVLDTKWSPIHPALFAAVDGTGRLDLWNLNSDMEVPTATTMAESNVALNNCLWHQSGHQIAVGDDLGKIHIYDVNEFLANPKPDEWQRFVHTLQEMKQNQADQDEDKTFMSSPLR